VHEFKPNPNTDTVSNVYHSQPHKSGIPIKDNKVAENLSKYYSGI